jgi:hypothetical protein
VTRPASIDRIAFHSLRLLVARLPRRLIVLVALTGCRGLLGIDEPIVGDARSADAPEVIDAVGCTAQSARFTPCALGQPQPALHLLAGGYTFDTTPNPAVLRADVGAMTIATTSLTHDTPGQLSAVVLYLGGLTIDSGATVKVIGARAAIIAADGAMAISGTIDAGSHMQITDASSHTSANVQLGAGANENCGMSAGRVGAAAASTAGSGGGGGGGYYGDGGGGGPGDNNNAPGGALGTNDDVPARVRGGCAGGSSGAAGVAAVSPSTQASVSAGGAGGGAIHLWSSKAIKVSGAVLAGGAGGAGSMQGAACGGGGGGSGGYIGLEAPSIELSGDLSANGGGGGGGGLNASFASNGSDGRAGIDVASGGSGSSSCGTAGAAGGALGLGGGSVISVDSCGGGGGGGGAGYILIWTPALSAMNATISPAAMRDLP